MVVATFGRGFYVLDNYTSLRELNPSIPEKEAHIFEIDETLLYFPSSNLNYQGDVHFRAKNPNPAATFEYYVKNGFESLKQQRIKKQKASEKSETYYYPSEEELRLESDEVKPNLVFTIYNNANSIVRKIEAPLKKGYNSISWDLSYLTNRGIKVPPGTYKVALDKNENGKFTRLVEPTAFKVISLPNALGTPNYEANFNFLKDVYDLNANVTAANGKIKDMNARITNMKAILEKTPVEANTLVTKLNDAQKEVDNVAKIIVGGFGAKNSVASRNRYALYTTSSAQVDITGAQKEQFKLAQDAFNGISGKLNALFTTEIPSLEKEFENAGGVLFNVSPQRRYNEE